MTVTGTNHSAWELQDGSTSPGPRRAIESEDLFRFRFVTAADLSPAGGSIVFALTRTDVDANTDHTDLFLLGVETGDQRQLTRVDAVNTAPAFSPDGRQVAFLSTRTGSPQIFTMPVDGGEAYQVTAVAQGVGGGPVWSPDGSRIAFTAGPAAPRRDPSMPYRVRRAIWRIDHLGLVDDALQDIYIIDAVGAAMSRLTDDAFLNSSPRWTPDGDAVIYTAAFEPDSFDRQNRLRQVDLDGVVTDVAGGGVITSHAVCADGRIVYLLTNGLGELPGTKADLWIYDPATGAKQRRTAGLTADVGGRVVSDMPSVMFTMGTVLVSSDSRFAYAPAQRGGEVNVLRIALSGPESYERVVGGNQLCAPVRLCEDRLLFAAFGVFSPGDLCLYDTAEDRQRQVTQLNTDLLAELQLPTVHRLEFASIDGAGVEGWYLEPSAGQRPYPTVLGIHGGPHAGWGYTFNFDFLMLAGAGYGVAYLNHRGSTGYGNDFATQINSDWGNLDYEDLMAGVDHAIELGLADSDRLGVFGVSGGGTLTGWIIGHTDRFKAACPENPLFNFFSIYGTSDLGVYVCHSCMGGPPHERAEIYQRCSPISSAHRCTTPTLFLQHENDYRSPAEQTEQFYTILKVRGVTAEMLRFQGARTAARPWAQ